MKREKWGDIDEDQLPVDRRLQPESDSSEDEEESGNENVMQTKEAGVDVEEDSESNEEFREFKRAKIEELYGEEVATEAFKIDDAIKDAMGESKSDSEVEDEGIADIDESTMEKARIAEEKRLVDNIADVEIVLDETLLWAIKSIWKIMESQKNNDETVQKTLQRLNLKRKNTTKRKDMKKNQQKAMLKVIVKDPNHIIKLEDSTLDDQIRAVIESVDLLEKNSNFSDILSWTRNEVFESRGFIKGYDRKDDSLW